MAFNFATSGQIARKAGKNVSSDAIKNVELLEQLSNEAEALINSTARADVIASSGLLAVNFKNIILDTITSHGAMGLINYDMTSYPTLGEAQTMLNVLDDRVKRNLEIIKEDKWKEASDAI